MDIRGLRYFIKLAECLNFTHAAKECYITQTAMSQNIAKMEEELGFQLFKRNNRSVELTPAGRDFYGRMYTLVKGYDDAIQHSSNLANGREGLLKVAVPSCMDGLTLMDKFKEFKEMYPAVELRLQLLEPNLIMDSIKQGKIDAAICWAEEKEQEEKDILTHIITTYQMYVVTSLTHYFSKFEKIPMDLLFKEKNILVDLKAGIGMEKLFSTVSQLSENNSIIIKKKIIEEILLSIELDDTIALLPEYIKQFVSDKMKFIPLDMESQPMMPLAIKYRSSNLNPALQNLIEIVCEL